MYIYVYMVKTFVLITRMWRLFVVLNKLMVQSGEGPLRGRNLFYMSVQKNLFLKLDHLECKWAHLHHQDIVFPWGRECRGLAINIPLIWTRQHQQYGFHFVEKEDQIPVMLDQSVKSHRVPPNYCYNDLCHCFFISPTCPSFAFEK